MQPVESERRKNILRSVRDFHDRMKAAIQEDEARRLAEVENFAWPWLNRVGWGLFRSISQELDKTGIIDTFQLTPDVTLKSRDHDFHGEHEEITLEEIGNWLEKAER